MKEETKNQCDGCIGGYVLKGGLHYNQHGTPFMSCQKDKYTCHLEEKIDTCPHGAKDGECPVEGCAHNQVFTERDFIKPEDFDVSPSDKTKDSLHLHSESKLKEELVSDKTWENSDLRKEVENWVGDSIFESYCGDKDFDEKTAECMQIIDKMAKDLLTSATIKARQEGYADGYKQGRFDVEADKEFLEEPKS